MSLNQYIQRKFPNLKLGPPLFYRWDIGIRFELGMQNGEKSIHENPLYLKGVYERAITLFKTVHAPEDDITIIVDICEDEGGRKTTCPKLFSKYVRDKSLLFQIQYHSIFSDYTDDAEENHKIYRFTLSCKTADFKYIPCLKAICNQDMGINPSFFHRVYFINHSRDTIFHVYDDRGCDLLATSTDAISGIYDTFNDWILNYDRVQVERVFGGTENGRKP